ncbi:MAG: endolytic transglycosylase MltG [Deltaproteobacteria bacterium]|nr:endolytic transglycosylase MltG [Deltaproteobacteria bacterium]
MKIDRFKKVPRWPVLIASLLIFLGGIAFLAWAGSPIDGRKATVIVEIPKGSSFTRVVDLIEQAGMVSNRPCFYMLSIALGATRQIKAGEYEFSTAMTPIGLIDRLVRGEIKKYPILIPEDFTVREIADRLAAQKLVNEESFMALASDRAFLRTLGIEADSVEGYLYPDTYHFDRSMTEKDVMRKMVGRFREVVTRAMFAEAASMGMTPEEFVILASMIGKESGCKEEKPFISAVFHNRLKRGMKLQCDPTAVYRLEGSPAVVMKRHLQKDTPYNTYRIGGLPPGPIANPGLDSLKAALQPAQVNYLYFVSKNDGSHEFSSTLTAHNRAVIKYQIERQKD